MELKQKQIINRLDIFRNLISLQYNRSDYGFHRGTFRVRGDNIDIFPAYEDLAFRIKLDREQIVQITKINPFTGQIVNLIKQIYIYPAKHYLSAVKNKQSVFKQIEQDLDKQINSFQHQGKLIEAQRLQQRVSFDLEMIKEIGYINGIENYSRYFDGRKPGDPPFTLFDYFQKKYNQNWLLFIDESHMTIPQISGMYKGDVSRKQTLIDFGFRLPAALDNRPLTFNEFLHRIPQVIYVSATPSIWEISRAKDGVRHDKSGIRNNGIVEQLIRPTALVDPKITVRPTHGQIPDLINEISLRVKVKQRILVTTLTKRMAEDLADYLKDRKIKVHYLHSDIKTLERTDILDDLRRGKYDVIVGINLLREGLDLPEVSLVAILDADKEGFLRSQVSLIQTMGRASRHVSGEVIMYADNMTRSMTRAIAEVVRRRKIQLTYNQKHHITPQSISKPFRDKLIGTEEFTDPVMGSKNKPKTFIEQLHIDQDSLTPQDRQRLIKRLEKEMRFEAQSLNFELAAQIRDKILELKKH